MNVPLFNLHKQHQSIQPQILKQWQRLLERTEFISGPEVAAFEKEFAEFCQVKHAVAVSSGTASLIIALQSLNIKPGDEVITTPMTFSATVDAIRLAGAKPVFADISPDTGNLDPVQVEKKVTPKTKGILLVHLYGVPCDLDEFQKICQKHKLWLIEDASHAHGTEWKGKKVGSFGQVGCFSLYPAKTLGAAGSAGVLVTNDDKIAALAREYANHGRRPDNKYFHYRVGNNLVLGSLQAAVLRIKLPLLPNWITRKRSIVDQYNRAFAKHGQEGMKFSKDALVSPYVYALKRADRDRFQSYMKGSGVDTGVYYPLPLHLQPAHKDLGYIQGDFPLTEEWAEQVVSLPLYPELTDAEVEHVIQSIHNYFAS